MQIDQIHLEEESANDRYRVVEPLLFLCLRQEGVLHEQAEAATLKIQHLIEMFNI